MKISRDIASLSEDISKPDLEKLVIDLAKIQKQGFDHFMLKEIFEQPHAVVDTLRGRLKLKQGVIKMAGIDDYIDKFIAADKITIIACGTSWHAGLVAEYMFEKIAKISKYLKVLFVIRFKCKYCSSKN